MAALITKNVIYVYYFVEDILLFSLRTTNRNEKSESEYVDNNNSKCVVNSVAVTYTYITKIGYFS